MDMRSGSRETSPTLMHKLLLEAIEQGEESEGDYGVNQLELEPPQQLELKPAQQQRDSRKDLDYSTLKYPLKWLRGNSKTRINVPFGKQTIYPSLFCQRLDQMNPQHTFTLEQYYRAWDYFLTKDCEKTANVLICRTFTTNVEEWTTLQFDSEFERAKQAMKEAIRHRPVVYLNERFGKGKNCKGSSAPTSEAERMEHSRGKACLCALL